MLISKFNKLIRSKILWGILAITIAFFFVGASVMSRGGCAGPQKDQTSEGILFGEPVKRDAFFVARFYEAGMRPLADNSKEALAALRDRTWRRLTALRMAARMGITVTDDDIRSVITQDPTFQTDGVFDRQRYLGVLQSQIRIDPATFEDYLRQDTILRRLMAALQTATWTTPYEIRPRLAKLTDEVNIDYAIVPETLTPDDEVEVTEDAIQAYFETYRDSFRIDEQLKVRFVRFPIEPGADTVEVTESEIDAFYADNIDDYTTVDTNGTEIVQPLDAVATEIETLIRQRKARWMTKDNATRLVMALAPDRYGQASDLPAAAQAQGLTVMTSDWFTASQPIPGLEDAGLEAASAAFSLAPRDPERYFSDAIVGSNAVYVLADQDHRPARDPELNEVRDQVAAAAQIKAVQDARDAQVERMRNDLIAAAADTSQYFVAAAQELGLSTATTGVFAVYEGLPEDTPYSAELMTHIIDAEEGTVLEATESDAGTLIAHIAHRTPGDPAGADMLRPQFVQTMDRYRAAAVYDEWISRIMQKANFEDYHPITN